MEKKEELLPKKLKKKKGRTKERDEEGRRDLESQFQ